MENATARRRRAVGPDDEEPRLVRDCIAGDPDAWTRLLRRYADLIWSIPLRRGLSREAAEDIFQSVSITLSQRLHLIQDPTCLPKWLIVTTVRRTNAYLAERRRTIDPQDLQLTEPEDPEAILARDQIQGHVRQALGELKPRDREILLDLFDHERSYAEIAARHGLALGSLGALRARALARLRRALERRGVL